MNRRQLLQGAGAALTLPAVPAIAVAAPAGPTVTSLLADYWRVRAEYSAAHALLKATPGEPSPIDAECDRLCNAFLAIESEICRTTPRDIREAVALLGFVRRCVLSDPDADDQDMSDFRDGRDFAGIDGALAVLERAVR